MSVFKKRVTPASPVTLARKRSTWYSQLFTKNHSSSVSSPSDQKPSLSQPVAWFGLAGSLFFFFAIVTLVSPPQVEPFAYLPLISAVFLIIFFVATLATKHPRRAFFLAYSSMLLLLFQLRSMFHWYVIMLILPLLFIEVILTKMKKE